MSFKKQLEKMGATPGKLALIGVLALVLVIVIVKQLPKGAIESPSAGASVATQQPAPADESGVTNSTTSSAQQRKQAPWPDINMAETLANDPFEAPAWADQEEPASRDISNESGELAELQEQGASIVVIAAGRKSASIGDQRVRVGDVLDGYKITDITTQGVLLNKLDPR